MRQAWQSGKLLFSNRFIDTCGRATTLRVDANVFENGEKKVAFSNEYGYVWTGP